MKKIGMLYGKVKTALTAFYVAVMILLTNKTASADVTSIDATSFNTKLVDVLTSYLTPLGGTIILIALAIAGVKMLITSNSPEKRKETMSGLVYVFIGAILIGGVMFFAGVLLGVGSSFTPAA